MWRRGKRPRRELTVRRTHVPSTSSVLRGSPIRLQGSRGCRRRHGVFRRRTEAAAAIRVAPIHKRRLDHLRNGDRCPKSPKHDIVSNPPTMFFVCLSISSLTSVAQSQKRVRERVRQALSRLPT